jgi:hypothetical protein
VKKAFTVDFSSREGLFANMGPIGDLEKVDLLKPATDKDLDE